MSDENTEIEASLNEGGDTTTDIETRAKEMGWAPKAEFRGDPEKWIDADTFVERGENLLPIVRAENRKLRGELDNLRQQNQSNTQLLQAATESIEELKNFNSAIAKEKVKEKRTELADAIKQAREDGDVEKELELTEQFDEAGRALTEAAARPTKKAPPTPPSEAPQDDPEFKQWMTENPWFGKDTRRTNFAIATAQDLRAQNITGRMLLDKVNEEVNATFGQNQRRNGASKVEGGKTTGDGGGGGGNGFGGKSYSDLPPDAKVACEKQGKRLVGPGRAFKDDAAWRKHYVSKYFE